MGARSSGGSGPHAVVIRGDADDSYDFTDLAPFVEKLREGHDVRGHAVSERVDIVFRAVRPGGLFAFWENNPWNPGTRYIMAQCEFDRDAMMLSTGQAERLLSNGK